MAVMKNMKCAVSTVTIVTGQKGIITLNSF